MVKTALAANAASVIFAHNHPSGVSDPSKPASPGELGKLMENIRQMTMIGETEINNAIVSCARARIDALELMAAVKPTLH